MRNRIIAAAAKVTTRVRGAGAASYEAAARLRYEAFVVHGGESTYSDADHDRGQIRSAHDHLPGTQVLLAGPLHAPLGTATIRAWRAGEMPADIRERYAADQFPALLDLPGAELSRLAVSPQARGKLVAVALVLAAAEWACREVQPAYAMGVCAPKFLEMYRRMGLRPYGAPLLEVAAGLWVPVIGLAQTVAEGSSLLAPTVARMRRTGLIHPRTPSLAAQISGGERPVLRVSVSELQRLVPGAEGMCEEAKALVAHAMHTLEVPAGTRFVREGVRGGGLVRVVRGRAVALRGRRCLGELGEGAVVDPGVAMGDRQHHTLTAKAVTEVRVAHLPGQALRQLQKRFPNDARTLMGAA